MKRVLLATLLLCSCSHPRKPEPPAPPKPTLASLIDSPRIPVVHFTLRIQSDWTLKAMWESCDTEEKDFTLQQAVKYGIPSELWVYCLMTYGETQRVTIFFVPKVKA